VTSAIYYSTLDYIQSGLVIVIYYNNQYHYQKVL